MTEIKVTTRNLVEHPDWGTKPASELKNPRPITFTFDGDATFPGIAAGGTWNGFDNVKITVATAREIDAHFQAVADRGGWQNEDPPLAELPVGEDGLIDLSNGFATQIVDTARPMECREAIIVAIEVLKHDRPDLPQLVATLQMILDQRGVEEWGVGADDGRLTTAMNIAIFG